MRADVGVVAIGRNEGDRLRRCLESVVDLARVVYVDSGSTDGSLALARSLGVEVVELDLSGGFTAARARNAGFARLEQIAPEVRFVQFVDGDCEVQPGWIDQACAAMQAESDLAVACGRRRERHPEQTIYNRMADIEWDTPVGRARACGGDAMMRVEAFRAAGGYNASLIAGEEPELCLRLRNMGYHIVRLDAEMTLHDLAMTRFGQWWRRTVRSGHAYAEGAWRHGRGPGRPWVRQSVAIWAWTLGLPVVALGLAWPSRGASLLLLLAWLWPMARASRTAMRRGQSLGHALAYGALCLIGKLPQLVGQWKFFAGRAMGRREGLIEYKDATPATPARDQTAASPQS